MQMQEQSHNKRNGISNKNERTEKNEEISEMKIDEWWYLHKMIWSVKLTGF